MFMNEIELFLKKSADILYNDKNILALCIGGSWVYKEMDEYSDLDLILITKDQINDSKDKMYEIASRLGNIVAGFTGEHVGESRLLICLYKNPVLHVDLKFLQLNEFDSGRIEDPNIIWERNNSITKKIKTTLAPKETVDYQWIEDRFWVWIHYAAAKLGRGELFEALDFLSFIRATVIGPLYHIKYNNLPRGVRKLELKIKENDIKILESTIAAYTFDSIKEAITNVINIYNELRSQLFPKNIVYLTEAENTSREYLKNIRKK
jgi:predicted nucleotidyltransferase